MLHTLKHGSAVGAARWHTPLALSCAQEPNFYTSRCQDDALTCSLHEQQKYINKVRHACGWPGLAFTRQLLPPLLLLLLPHAHTVFVICDSQHACPLPPCPCVRADPAHRARAAGPPAHGCV